MRSNKSELLVNLNVDLNVNNHSVKAYGMSKGIPESGNISAVLHAENDAGFNLGMLSYVLLTGLPLMSFAKEGSLNPFIETKGVYKAIRTLTLNKNYGFLRAEYTVNESDVGLNSIFHIEGTLNLPKLVSIAPTIETWVPNGPGEILGHFTMCWLAENGEYVKGEADTHYILPTQTILPTVQFREILIDFKADERRLEQKERIVIFALDMPQNWNMCNHTFDINDPRLMKAS